MQNEDLPRPHMTPTPMSDSHELSLTAARNLAVAMSLRATAWHLTAAGLRTFRPHLSESEVQAEVRAQFRRSTD
jgi:hypothetical protein